MNAKSPAPEGARRSCLGGRLVRLGDLRLALSVLLVHLDTEGRFEGLVEGLPAGAVGDTLHTDGGEEAGRRTADEAGVGEVHLALAFSRHTESHTAGENFHTVERLGGHIVFWVGLVFGVFRLHHSTTSTARHKNFLVLFKNKSSSICLTAVRFLCYNVPNGLRPDQN